MPFIGNQPALSYTSFAKQDFTTSATTSYTLDNPVANANELALFINFVRQEPTTAYSASGTSLTLTSATSATDDMYCVFLGKAVQTVNPPNASVGLSQLTATGTKDATTFLRGDNTFASAGGDNTPMFKASMSGNQSIANETFVKGAFNTEIFDTNSAYDTSNYRFTVPSGEGGKYCFVSLTAIDNLDSGEAMSSAYYINGSRDDLSYNTQWVSKATNGFGVVNNVFIKTLAAADYVELFVSHNEGGSQNLSATYSSFGGYKLIT
jgi:hypothetical protein